MQEKHEHFKNFIALMKVGKTTDSMMARECKLQAKLKSKHAAEKMEFTAGSPMAMDGVFRVAKQIYHSNQDISDKNCVCALILLRLLSLTTIFDMTDFSMKKLMGQVIRSRRQRRLLTAAKSFL